MNYQHTRQYVRHGKLCSQFYDSVLLHLCDYSHLSYPQLISKQSHTITSEKKMEMCIARERKSSKAHIKAALNHLNGMLYFCSSTLS